MADVTLDWRHVMETAAERNIQTLVYNFTSPLIIITKFTSELHK